MIFYHFWSIFDIKIKTKLENASRRVEMLAFCVNMYFQLKSTSLSYFQTNIDYSYRNLANILNILRIVQKIVIF